MKQTTLFPQSRIQFLDNAFLINDQQEKILVIADLHIGYEESFVEKGIFPRFQTHEIITNLNKIFDNLNKNQNIKKLDKIIILGDLKHEHGKISDAEWRETLHVLDFLTGKTKEIILIKGNHDNILGPIAGKRNVKLKPYYQYKDILFMHGHKEYKTALKNKNIKIIILGHLHPAITLSDEYKKEKYKCFLFGKYKRKQTYILPNFNPISRGYDLRDIGKYKKDLLFIKNKKFKSFNIIISSQSKAYDFGKLKKLLN
tara:strand:+ start:3407 stop:4177 length:771 start_codon:yes stop_codon:yes gene_type:complete